MGLRSRTESGRPGGPGSFAGSPHSARSSGSLLGEGVAIENVSILLGHRSIQTTERYYAPWDRRRRERLNRIVKEANRSDPVLADIDP